MLDVRGTARPRPKGRKGTCPAPGSAASALALALALAGAGALAASWLMRRTARGAERRPGAEAPTALAAGKVARSAEGPAATTRSSPGEMGPDEALRRLRAAEAAVFDELRLSAQERCIARHVVRGLTYREIAERAYLAERTVKYHARSIYAKARVDNRRAFEAYVRATLDASPGGGGAGGPTARI